MQLKHISFSRFAFFVKNLSDRKALKVNPFKLLYLTWKGYHVNSMVNRPLTLENYKDYLPYSSKHKVTLNTNNGYWPVLHDKLIFYKFMKEDLPVAELLATIFNGRLSPLAGPFGLEELLAGLLAAKTYVLKPLRGGQGHGVVFLTHVAGQFMLGTKVMTEAELLVELASMNAYGIFSFYEQHIAVKRLYPESVNTIRLVTLFDFERNEPFINHAYLRLGTSKSKPLDNYRLGGIVASIDLESGVLSEWLREDVNGAPVMGIHHPDSQVKIPGFVVPHWELVKTTMLDYLAKNPYLDYIGWDILVTNEGMVVIEGNHNPGSDQVLLPYLKDQRARMYFSKLGIQP